VLRRTRRDRVQTRQELFGRLLKRIEVEWALVSEKAGSVFEAVTGNGQSTNSE
jgi:hypothetical protein